MSQRLTPITASERLPVIDLLRGIAILGILVMNVKHSSFPVMFSHLWPSKLEGMIETVTYWVLEFFMYGKFFSLFTLLFGVGMAVQVSRAIAKGSEEKFPMVYFRRMVILLAIGFLHEMFIWRGVVLLWYPIIGILLLLFHKLKPGLMLVAGLGFILLTCGINTYQITQYRPPSPAVNSKKEVGKKPVSEMEKREMKEKKKQRRKKMEQAAWKQCNAVIKTYREGDYSDIVADQLSIVPSSISFLKTVGGYLLGMFLLGVWLWRRAVFQDLSLHRPFLVKLFRISLITGVILTGILTYTRIWGGPENPGVVLTFILVGVRWFSLPSLAACYLAGLLLLYESRPNFRRLLKPIEAVGRMAFSNYVFQSLAMGLIYYNYGLGLIGRTGPLENLLVCLVIYAVQIYVTVLWLKYFRFGPIEWLWRSLTYWKRQPLKRSGSD